MTSYRYSTPLPHLACAREPSGAYDAGDPSDRADHDHDDMGRDGLGRDRAPDAPNSPQPGPPRDPDDPGPAAASPLAGLADALDELETARRRVLEHYHDVTAWGGTATTTGYTRGEWLSLRGRVPGREQWKYDLLVTRLPALPVTAALYQSGKVSFNQAVSIVSGTKRLNGDTLADVEAAAAHAAAGRNRRGDRPDVDDDVETLVQQTRTASEQDRRDRDRLDRNQVRIQPDLFGAGRITEDWADPEGFQTRVAAIDHAAGQPHPDLPRSQQLAEGSLATARAWLAGTATHPLNGRNPDTSGGDTLPARPVDPADVDPWLLDTLDHPELPGTPDLPGPPDAAASPDLPGSPDEVNLGPSSARPTLLVRIDLADLTTTNSGDGSMAIDPTDPASVRRLATGSDAAFGRLVPAGRISSAPWLGRQLIDTLACNADLLVAIVDGERPLAEFRNSKRLPDRIRRQVLWRDLGCRWPGCRAPVAHCDVHHLDGDPTNHDVDNLGGFCRPHHRRLHSTFWHYRLDGQTGRFDLLRSPDGDPVHTTYPRGTNPRLLNPPEVD